MIRRTLWSVLVPLVSLVSAALLLGACSSKEPASKSYYEQATLTTVQSWNDVADTIAQRVRNALETRRDLINRPLYVQPPNEREFALAFYNLLRTRMVAMGMQVSDKREPDGLAINYSVQTVRHDGSSYEVIVNASMLHKNRYVMHMSVPSYIDDDEWAMYISPESFDPNGTQTRTVRLVGR